MKGVAGSMASATQAGRPSAVVALLSRPLPLPEQIISGGRSTIALRWVLSRALTVSMLVFAHEGDVAGDVRYYARSLHQLFSGGTLSDTLQEYPLPVLGLLMPQFL